MVKARHLHIIPIRILRIVCRLLTKIVVHDVVLCTSLHYTTSQQLIMRSLFFTGVYRGATHRNGTSSTALLTITTKVSPL